MAQSSTQPVSDPADLSDLLNGNNGQNAIKYDTPLAVYKRLLEITLNEATAPELQMYEEEIVDGITDQIEHMNANLIKHRDKTEKFCIDLHELELERFRYILSKYHRERIMKIERNANHLIRLIKTDRQASERLMSPLEMKYLDKYVDSINSHLENVVSSKLPSSINSFKLSDVPYNVNLEHDTNYVFVEVTQDTSVTVDDLVMGQEVVELKKGSKYFLPYSAVRSHLTSIDKNNLIKLI